MACMLRRPPPHLTRARMPALRGPARHAGHETTFVALLYCLAKLGVVGAADAQALVTRAFRRYLQLMRKVQVRLRCCCAGWWVLVGESECCMHLLPHSRLAPPSDHVLAGAGGQPWRVGAG